MQPRNNFRRPFKKEREHRINREIARPRLRLEWEKTLNRAFTQLTKP